MKKRACSTLAGVLILLFLSSGVTYGSENRGYEKLDSKNCYLLNDDSRAKLPSNWGRYAPYTKACPLAEGSGKAAAVSIIAVWVEDFYAKQPPDTPWEKFPKPLIVGQDMQELGELPELYPVDEPREVDVYYGHWQQGKPTEIQVDVYNPAVSGDYYYPPIRYNKDSGYYEMKDRGVIYGTRLR